MARPAGRAKERAATLPAGFFNPPRNKDVMADELYYYQWEFNRWLGSQTRTDMSLNDRAIYRDLLDHQAASGSLPDNLQGLANRAMCSIGQMDAFMQRWGDKLFPIGDDGARRNAVLQANRDAIIARRNIRSTAGVKGAEARWHGKRNGKRNADAMASKSKSKNKRKEEPPNPPGGGVSVDFDAWWEAYPHKVGKKAACKAYTVARKVADHDTLMAGVASYARSKPPDRAWCNPQTWLNQGRWEDQPAGGGKAKPASAMSALTPDQERELYEFTLAADPSIAGMPMGQDAVRRAMRKHLDDWRAA